MKRLNLHGYTPGPSVLQEWTEWLILFLAKLSWVKNFILRNKHDFSYFYNIRHFPLILWNLPILINCIMNDLLCPMKDFTLCSSSLEIMSEPSKCPSWQESPSEPWAMPDILCRVVIDDGSCRPGGIRSISAGAGLSHCQVSGQP